MLIDLDRIETSSWTYTRGMYTEGVQLSRDGVVYYREETHPGLGAASGTYSFEDFLRDPGNGYDVPERILREVMAAIEHARMR